MQWSPPPTAGWPPPHPEPWQAGPPSRLPAYLREEPRHYWPAPPQPPSPRRRFPIGWILMAALLVVVPGSAAVLAFSSEEVVALEPARPGVMAAFQLPGVPRVAIADQEVIEVGSSPDRQLGLPAEGGPEFARAPGGGVRGYAEQPVQWLRCDDDLCARVLAPLDWERPDDRAIWLSMRKVSSGDASRGTLFVNPGGPGMEGQSHAIDVPKWPWRGYDVIGWDPRGTGQSTPVQCGGDDAVDRVRELDYSPDDDVERRALVEGMADFARGCRAASGDLLDHLGTVDVVRDLDLLRHLVGQRTLNYLGVSYGTYVGAVYAQLFPERVGRMVLDSATTVGAPWVSTGDLYLDEEYLGEFAQWCVDQGDCPLGDSAETVLERIDGFLDGLDRQALLEGDRRLTQTMAAMGVSHGLQLGEYGYPDLRDALTEALAGDGGWLLALDDERVGRVVDDGYDPSTTALQALLCSDEADRGYRPVLDQWADSWRIAESQFSRHLGVELFCEVWAAEPSPRLKIAPTNLPRILVIGATDDPITPYRDSVDMAHQLPRAILLTMEADWHGVFGSGSECIDRHVATFVREGRIPEGQWCEV